MASHPTKDDEKVSKTIDDGQVQIAVGSIEERSFYTPRTFFRSVLFQMILFGALSLVGPAMSDAITNLGGGGLATPWLANLANSLNYVTSFLSTIVGGPIINRIGIKWACLIAALTMPLHGSAYYVNARYSNAPYLLAANVVRGIGNGFLYVGETTAMLSYPRPEDRGLYLGIWSAMRNSGSVIGGAINFSTNHNESKGGGVVWATYLIFVGFECTGFIWALLLSPTPKVRRKDNSKVNMSVEASWKEEFLALWDYLKEGKTWLMFIPSFYSFFYGGTMGTYLSLHFSVRARALSSLLVPTITIPSVIMFGKLLDSMRWSQRRRAWTAFSVWGSLQIGCLVWVAIEYSILPGKVFLDYKLQSHRWAQAYIPYLIVFVSGYWTQLTLYWILSTLSNDVGRASRSGGVFRAFETAGQAVSYGLSSANNTNHVIPLYVNIALLVLTIPSLSVLITKMPRRPQDLVPASQKDVDQHEAVPDDFSKCREG